MAKAGFELRPRALRALPIILHEVTENILGLSLNFTGKRNLLLKLFMCYIFTEGKRRPKEGPWFCKTAHTLCFRLFDPQSLEQKRPRVHYTHKHI